MKKTGEILKNAREEKGLSLNEVGLALKIGSKVLKAIEEGDEKNLPAKTFLRGFVKSYATYLRLDAEKVLEIFYEEYGSTKPKPYIRPGTEITHEAPTEKPAVSAPESAEVAEQAPVEAAPEVKVTPLRQQSSPHPTPPRAEPYNPLQEKKNTKTIAIFVIGAVLVGLIIFTKRMIDKYTKEAEVPTAQVEQTMEGATPVTPSISEAPVEPMNPQASPAPSPLSNLTHPASTPAPASSMVTAKPAAPAPTAGATPATTPTPAPSATPAPTVKPVASATPTPAASPATATGASAPTPTPSPTAKPEEKNKPVELIVEALDSVEIEYSAPNGKPQKIKLSAEQVHTFKSRSGLRINFSNGGAVNLILNGKEIGIPGDLGKPIKLSY